MKKTWKNKMAKKIEWVSEAEVLARLSVNGLDLKTLKKYKYLRKNPSRTVWSHGTNTYSTSPNGGKYRESEIASVEKFTPATLVKDIQQKIQTEMEENSRKESEKSLKKIQNRQKSLARAIKDAEKIISEAHKELVAIDQTLMTAKGVR